MKNTDFLDKLLELIKPIVIKSGYELYYIEFVKEEEENYLRIYIDNPNGIGLSDCEKVSRQVSAMLDIEDPIPYSYYLEVSSPGIDRIIHNDEHLSKYIGSSISIKLFKLFNGNKKYEGKLKSFDASEIVIENEGAAIVIPRDRIHFINLNGDI